jgi:hypothetical protein
VNDDFRPGRDGAPRGAVEFPHDALVRRGIEQGIAVVRQTERRCSSSAAWKFGDDAAGGQQLFDQAAR